MKDKVDIIIPSKNETESLIFTLGELENFTFYDQIIIVVDSQDDPALKFLKNLKNVKLISKIKKVMVQHYVRVLV